jgi:hypothetical protein
MMEPVVWIIVLGLSGPAFLFLTKESCEKNWAIIAKEQIRDNRKALALGEQSDKPLPHKCRAILRSSLFRKKFANSELPTKIPKKVF